VAYTGGFEFDVLPPGVYRFELLDGASRDSLFVLDEIEIVEGLAAYDPRLDPIDLRGKLRSVVVDARDVPSQRTLDDAWLVVDDGAKVATRRYLRGPFTWRTTAEKVDVAVRARGYVTAAAVDVRGTTVIELRRAPTVHLTLPLGVASPPEGSLLTCTLQRRPSEDGPASKVLQQGRSWASAPSVSFGTRRTGALTIDAPGSYELVWTAWAAREGGSRRRTVLAPQPGASRIEVRLDGAGEQFFVAPSSASYTEWLASLSAER
jgi:hypothetical protein